MPNPPKILKIDRSRYQDLFTKPVYDFVGDDGGFTSDILKGHGFDYLAGTEKAGDLIAKKGNNYYLYNKNPGGQAGLVNIGDPYAQKPVTSPPTPIVPKEKPVILDPMKQSGFNGVLHAQFKNGGKVKGYDNGGVVDPNPTDKVFTKENTGALVASAGAGLGAYMATPQAETTTPEGFKKQDTTRGDKIAATESAVAPALNMVVPGLGTAVSVALPIANDLKNKQLEKMQKINPETGEFENAKTAKLGAGLNNASTLQLNDLSGEKTYNDLLSTNTGIVKANKQKALESEMSQSTNRAFNERGFSQGGKIEGKGTAKSDSIPAKVNGFVVPAENAPVAELLRKKFLKVPVKKAQLNQKDGVKVKVSDGEHLFTPEEEMKLRSKGVDLDALAPNADSETNLANGTPPKTAAQKAKLYDSINGKSNLSEKRKAELYDSVYEEKPKKYLVDPKDVPSASQVYASKKVPVRAKVQPEVMQAKSMMLPERTTQPGLKTSIQSPEEVAFANQTQPESKDRNVNINANGLSDVGNYALPAFQVGMGLRALRDAGKRPVDALDKDYLQSIQSARNNVNVANANAKFGFTPEENFSINQQNQNLLNAGRSAARNYSGGSAASALTNERSAINDSYTRGLDAIIGNRNLKLAKQDIAYNRQGALDNLVSGKVEMSRRLFGDKMNAWNQNQQAGAGLLGAGIDNVLGASRYNKELQYMKDRDDKYNNFSY